MPQTVPKKSRVQAQPQYKITCSALCRTLLQSRKRKARPIFRPINARQYQAKGKPNKNNWLGHIYGAPKKRNGNGAEKKEGRDEHSGNFTIIPLPFRLY